MPVAPALSEAIGLGLVENPISKKREPDLDQAKFTIDTLEMLQEKTQGNLSEGEASALHGLLYDLRMRYVQAAG